MKNKGLMIVISVALLVLSAQSFASILGDWGVSGSVYTNGSFGNWTNTSPRTETGTTNGINWAEGNNTAPTNPVFGPPPSGGEHYDIEFLGWRVSNGQFQVLGITSVNPATGVEGFRMGDVFIDVDGAVSDPTSYRGYDLALSNGTWTSDRGYDNLHPGDGFYNHDAGVGLYNINGVDDVHGISTNQGYGSNNDIVDLADPFAIRGQGSLAGAATQRIDQIQDDNGVSNWAIEWSVDQSLFESLLPTLNDAPSYANLMLHWTMECGNDWLNTEAPGSHEPFVPEPATLSLLGLGLATFGLVYRRNRRVA